MNNSIVTPATTVSTWKSMRTHYVAAAAGVALSLSALVALSSTGSNTQPAPSTSRPLAVSSANAARGSAEVTFYLISSQAQIDKVHELEGRAALVRADSRVLEPDRSIMILHAGTASEEHEAQGIINDAMAASNFPSDLATPSFHIVDFRAE